MKENNNNLFLDTNTENRRFYFSKTYLLFLRTSSHTPNTVNCLVGIECA